MIASFLHNFIFVKTRKTAGTSAEIVLSTWCGERDIITPLSGEDELIRAAYGGLPRNFGVSPELEAAYIALIRKGSVADVQALRNSFKDVLRQNFFYNHMPATRVRSALPELWERAFKFTIERHPYEKVISRAYWIAYAHNDRRPIGDIVEDVISSRNLSDKPIYCDGDKVIVDKVIRFDDLWQEVASLAKTLQKRVPDPLPRAKGGLRHDKRPAIEQLTSDQKRRIAERCAVEFELMGFSC